MLNFLRLLCLLALSLSPKALAFELAPELVPERVYSLPAGETVSYYTRVAPDLSKIGFTRTKPDAFRHFPVVLDLRNGKMTPLTDVAYDPIFSPDYSEQKKQGFMIGARGGGSSYAKHFAFYLPGQLLRPKREYYFSNVSGYPTIAKLDDESVLPDALRPFVGKYLVMGKRWRWFILDAVTNRAGEVIDFKQVYPSGELAAPPFCPDLDVNFDKSDSMLSPKGRFISAKKYDRDKVPAIVRIKDCSILQTPSLDGLYGGKATFSNDERFVTFHAFGVDGRQHVVDQLTNEGLIKRWADSGLISNAFLYDISSETLTRLTTNSASNRAINFFPNFSGSGEWIYFHQHRQFGSSSEIFRLRNPAFSAQDE